MRCASRRNRSCPISPRATVPESPALTRVRGGGWSRPWVARLLARPGFQALIDRLPFAPRLARRDGAAIFDLLQGFVATQVLLALVQTGLLRRLLEGAQSADQVALSLGLSPGRAEQLLRAGVGLGLLRQRRGRFGLARKGAVILGVPGLEAMIRHNAVLYRDMADPMALLRGEGETHLQRFWPYVHGAGAAVSDGDAAIYSDLMAQSQQLVARDTLKMVSLRGVRHLVDIGGGSGVFLGAALTRWPDLSASLFDLPAVMPSAEARLSAAGLTPRVALCPGDFRTDPLPQRADAAALIRVLYDHSDETVRALLARIFAALPPGGRLIVAEPMGGNRRTDRACDVYFAFYTIAMGTGQLRTPARIAALCREAGFDAVRCPKPPRPFVTSAVEAVKPA